MKVDLEVCKEQEKNKHNFCCFFFFKKNLIKSNMGKRQREKTTVGKRIWEDPPTFIIIS